MYYYKNVKKGLVNSLKWSLWPLKIICPQGTRHDDLIVWISIGLKWYISWTIYSYMHRALFNPQKSAIWRYVSPHFWFLQRLKINIILENSQEVKGEGAWRVKNIVFQFYYQKICWVITIEFYFRTLWLVICTVNYCVKKC